MENTSADWVKDELDYMSQSEQQEKDHLFETEFLPYAEALYNFALHLTHQEEDANDLVQDTFLKAYRFYKSYQPGTNAKAWLFKILKNAFINNYRKKSKIPVQVEVDDLVTYHDNTYQGYIDARQSIFQDMLNEEIAEALQSLPIDFRTVVLLCDIEGFTYEEIAKIVDIPIGTVRSRLHRARMMLKEKLSDYARKLGYQNDDTI
ncbi:MAG: sigma-70 family RNA polymerase sigma factor [Chitinophagales bacterium]